MPNGIPDEFYVWLASRQGYEDISPEEAKRLFQDWAPAEKESIYARYLEELYSGRVPPVEPLPRGRPTAEKWPASVDWQALMMMSGKPKRVESELRKWLSTGYITQFQARDIWDELSRRVGQVGAGFRYGAVETAPEAIERRRVEEIERLKVTGERGMAGIPKWQLAEWDERVKKGEITEEQVTEYISKKEDIRVAAAERQRMARAWRYAPPQPRYEVGFEEERARAGGPQPWRDWFESQYPSLVGKFRAALPEMVPSAYPGLTPRQAGRQIEETWAETLRKRRPELREEYATRYPWGRYGRPGVMAPRIQTVKFT